MLPALTKNVKDTSVLRRLLFAWSNLPKDLPNAWKLAVEFATKNKDGIETDDQERTSLKLLLSNLEKLDASSFDNDDLLYTELLNTPTTDPLGVVLIPAQSKCTICGNNLLIRKDRPSNITVYSHALGTVHGSHYHKTCANRSCGYTQYYGYYTKKNSTDVYFDTDWNLLPYFSSSRDTFFSMDLMKQFNVEILLGQISFKQCAEIYNELHKCSHCAQDHDDTRFISTLVERHKLDRRRVEDAYYQFSLLQVCSWYPEVFNITTLPFHGKVDLSIAKITSQYHDAFMEKYAAHRCKKDGCGSVLVIDGNMKNHRSVCYATNAGYAEYVGLPGVIRTGCPNTPAYKSRFCSLHQPSVEDASSAQAQEPSGIIIGKRVTRQGTSYEVIWLNTVATKASWEMASKLPSSIIEEYENGVRGEIVETLTSGGQTVHTVLPNSNKSSSQPSTMIDPPLKKVKADESKFDAQFFASSENVDATCNTEKDRTRVNHRTAGVMLGAWPCGKIVMLGELFGAESKAQVYALFHAFLQQNSETTDDIRYLCYDDGCHLKRYAMNTKRANQTVTAARITSINIVIDKMHFRGHTDTWCRENCDPHKFKELDKVDTEICEQTFSWMSRYARITQHMSRSHFLFYLLYLCDSHNRLND